MIAENHLAKNMERSWNSRQYRGHIGLWHGSLDNDISILWSLIACIMVAQNTSHVPDMILVISQASTVHGVSYTLLPSDSTSTTMLESSTGFQFPVLLRKCILGLETVQASLNGPAIPSNLALTPKSRCQTLSHKPKPLKVDAKT